MNSNIVLGPKEPNKLPVSCFCLFQIGVSNLVGLSVGSIEVDQIEKVKMNIISFACLSVAPQNLANDLCKYQVEEDINRLILAHAIIAASIFALVCVYFPRFR